MIQIRDIKLKIDHTELDIKKKIVSELRLEAVFKNTKFPDFNYTIIKKSLDARKKPDIFFIYTVSVDLGINEDKVKNFLSKKKCNNIDFKELVKYKLPNTGDEPLYKRPVIIGSGPAGLFTALNLAKRGFKPIVIERGEPVEQRSVTVEHFFETGELDDESNVQFGEGGAGTFSDGKLNTLTKDTNGRNSYVLRTFYEYGANEDITYVAKPHIGTDVLKDVVKNMRNAIIDLGGQFMFDTKMTSISIKNDGINIISLMHVKSGFEFYIETDIVILCIGHSARDTFEMLYEKGLSMQQKNFAVGFRVSHPQRLIDRWQLGVNDANEIGLSAADYKVTNEASNGRNVYSFCMCPGGYVVNASSEYGKLAVNGMSERKRDSKYANSAIICSITPDDFIQHEVDKNHPLSGMYYQRNLEKEAFNRGDGKIPTQYFKDYENDVPSIDIKENDFCTKGSIKATNLRNIFSNEIDEAIVESIHKFGYTRKGFDADRCVLYGVETRTSSPIRITRDENFVSNINGVYPCGEGAGYAGGITSAAADGIRVAEAIISKYYPEY